MCQIFLGVLHTQELGLMVEAELWTTADFLRQQKCDLEKINPAHSFSGAETYIWRYHQGKIPDLPQVNLQMAPIEGKLLKKEKMAAATIISVEMILKPLLQSFF